MPSAGVTLSIRNDYAISQVIVGITGQTIGLNKSFDLLTYTATGRKRLYPSVTQRHPKTLSLHIKSYRLRQWEVFVGMMTEKYCLT